MKTTKADPYDTWRSSPTPGNLRKVVDAHKSTIDSALKSYTGGIPGNNIRRRAELMAGEAIKSFDPNRGTQLSTHMMNHMQSLRRVSRTFADPFPKPERLQQEGGRIHYTKQELSDQLGREPSLEELAEYGNFDLDKLRKVIRRERAVIPESALASEDDDDSDEEYMPGVKRNDPLAVWADYVYHDLSDTDRIIFQYRTGYNGMPVLSNQEIAARLKISPAAVSKRAQRIQDRLNELEEA